MASKLITQVRQALDWTLYNNTMLPKQSLSHHVGNLVNVPTSGGAYQQVEIGSVTTGDLVQGKEIPFARTVEVTCVIPQSNVL